MAVPVITTALLEAMIGRTLTASETARATYYIGSISSFMAVKCDLVSFEEVTDDVVRKQADYYGIIELGGGPISTITSVAVAGGTEVLDWAFDGASQLSGLEPFQTVAITYTHGEDVIPDELQYLAAEAVMSCITTQVSGPLKIRTVGDVTYSFAEGTNVVANLSMGILENYMTTEYSWRLGAHTAGESSRPENWFQVDWDGP